MMLSGYNELSTVTKSRCCLRFPGSKREITGLIPHRNNGSTSSFSYKCPALRSLLIYHSGIRLDPSLQAWPHSPAAGMPAGTPGHPRGRAGGRGSRGVAAWAGGAGSRRLRGDGGTLLPGDRAGGDRN